MRFGTFTESGWNHGGEAAGLAPIKLNTVVTRGFNDEDVVELAAPPWTAHGTCGSSS